MAKVMSHMSASDAIFLRRIAHTNVPNGAIILVVKRRS